MDINLTLIGQSIAMIVFVWFCMRFIWPPVMKAIEVRQTLARQRPETVGQAARISGITPAAISLLLVHLRRRKKQDPQQKKSA